MENTDPTDCNPSLDPTIKDLSFEDTIPNPSKSPNPTKSTGANLSQTHTRESQRNQIPAKATTKLASAQSSRPNHAQSPRVHVQGGGREETLGAGSVREGEGESARKGGSPRRSGCRIGHLTSPPSAAAAAAAAGENPNQERWRSSSEQSTLRITE